MAENNLTGDITLPENKVAALKNHVLDKEQLIMTPKQKRVNPSPTSIFHERSFSTVKAPTVIN